MTLPPGPQQSSLIQTFQIVSRPLGFLRQCAHQFGDTFTLRILGWNSPPAVFCSRPDTLQQIFTTLSPQLDLGQAAHVFRPLTGDRSLILLQGKAHQRQRQLLMPPLHGDRLHTYRELIQTLTQAEINTWQPGQIRSMQGAMLSISLEVILRVVFGLTPGCRYQQLKTWIESLLATVTDPIYSLQFFFPILQQDLGLWSPWGQFLQRQQQIDALIAAEIEERRRYGDPDRTDILSLLLRAEDEQGEKMTDQELRDQLITLLLLGHETTASALAWAFHWIHRDPKVRDQLLEEICSTQYSREDITQLPYLTAVCKESLRILPIALIAQPRTVQQPIQIEGFDLEPGTLLVPCIYLAHRRHQTYIDPETFNPDRFLRHKFSPYEFLPFGGGHRSCIGMALSLFEMKLILATILSEWDLALANPECSVYPVRRGITFVPSDGAQLKILRQSTKQQTFV